MLCHAVIEIIYNFDFRRLFDHKIQMGVCVALGLSILFCFKNDWLGYDTYLPKKEQVAEAAIQFDNEHWQQYAEVEMTGEDGAPVLEETGSTKYIFENMAVTNIDPVFWPLQKKGLSMHWQKRFPTKTREARGCTGDRRQDSIHLKKWP